jgi:ATP-dependent RNA circularization protein (DNA/RNA ligase family)
VTEFFRFPHTPHLAWLGAGQPRGDKVLGADEVTSLLGSDLVVEEKVDGANLGLSVDEDGRVRAQNRGSYLSAESAHPQFRPLWPWLATRQDALIDSLWPNLTVFGEWCVAVHSITYGRLPDWFLVFDVYDNAGGEFWSCSRRDELAARLGLAVVPRLGFGRHSLQSLMRLMGTSRLGASPMEGLVVRAEATGQTAARAKLVRPSFTQAIELHWSKGPLRRNSLVADAVHHPR